MYTTRSDKSKITDDFIFKNERQWAESKDYKPPIPFKEMQKKGRERADGTVIVCKSQSHPEYPVYLKTGMKLIGAR
jgi:hypothetical protein